MTEKKKPKKNQTNKKQISGIVHKIADFFNE
jgi:hypothetical protein